MNDFFMSIICLGCIALWLLWFYLRAMRDAYLEHLHREMNSTFLARYVKRYFLELIREYETDQTLKRK